MAKVHASIIILDMGRHSSTLYKPNQRSFFDNAKNCAIRLIERKILDESKNAVAVILMGANKTKNKMAEKYNGEFRNIEVVFDLVTPTWDMIELFPKQATENVGDWFDALLVAADLYKSNGSSKIFASKKIILMSNIKGASTVYPEALSGALKGFKEDGFEVDVIGPDLYSGAKGSKQEALQFVEITDGVAATFEQTMKYLHFFRKKAVKPMPWNVELSIGPNIKIPVSSYIRIKDEPMVKNWSKAVKDPINNCPSTSEALVKTKEFINPDNIKVAETDKISGYHYGQKIIPFSDCNNSMLYTSGEKCLSVYGFTNADNIKWQNLNGDGLQYVFGRKGDKKAHEAIRCLVSCLLELNLVGIVRKVHNNNNAPKMFVLLPVIDTDDYVCLSMIALCYKEDIKQMSFPSTNLKKYQCTDEQVNAFKDLINAMDLTKAYDQTYDDAEAFPIAECYSPTAQYLLECMARRALYPNSPLLPPKQEITNLFKVPPTLVKNAVEPIEKIKKLFTLNNVEPKPKKNKNVGMNIDLIQPLVDQNIDTDDGADVIYQFEIVPQPPRSPVTVEKIGTIDPISDFKILKNRNRTLMELGPEMFKVIENLFRYNFHENYVKPLNVMKYLRTEYVTNDPTDYNTWFKKFKTDLLECNKTDVLSLIAEKKASFILREENQLSTYDNEHSHEESQLYENDTLPQSAELTISSEIQDMFDD